MARRRGQMLLLAGFGLAITFVALALLVNSVVFAENLGTRETVDDAAPVVTQRAVESGVGGVLAAVNHRQHRDYASLETAFRAGVERWARGAARHFGASGTALSVGVVDTMQGTRVVQGESRSFRNASNASDWTVASDVGGVRRFEMTVQRDSLYRPVSGVGTDAGQLLGMGAFTVNVTGTGGTWSVVLYRKATDSSTVVVATVRPDGTVGNCTVSTASVTVDVTESTVNGRECEALSFPNGTAAPYDVRYLHGDQASGRYALVVDRVLGAVRDSDLTGRPGDSPYAVRALYGATVHVTFHSQNVRYATNVTVRPEDGPHSPYGVALLEELLVYVDNSTGDLSTMNRSGGVTTYPAGSVQVIGPARYDFDGDDRREVPYVNASGVLQFTDVSGETTVLATGADSTKSLVAVGAWNTSAASVLFTKTGDTILRVRPGEIPVEIVTASSYGVSAVGGVGDVDGDDAPELVYVDDSQQLRYLDDDGDLNKITNGGVGSNVGVGVGAPADFDGDSEARVPFVDGSNNLLLVDAAGNAKEVLSSGEITVDKSPVAAFDADADGALEIVFRHDGALYYAENVTSNDPTYEPLNTSDGSGVTVAGEPGVAS